MWTFTTGDVVRSSPAAASDGTVYAGSYDDQLWAITTLAEPRNYRQNLVPPPTPEQGQNLIAYDASPIATDPHPASFVPTDSNNWILSGPWAVRMEITRDTIAGDRGDYVLRTWLYQCGDSGCTDILGTFFENTRYGFDPGNLDPQLVQSFSLPDTAVSGGPDNIDFTQFLFGFTSASESGDTLQIVINNFQLSFIRPGDPVSTADFPLP